MGFPRSRIRCARDLLGKTFVKDRREIEIEQEVRDFTSRCGPDTCEKTERRKDWVRRVSCCTIVLKKF